MVPPLDVEKKNLTLLTKEPGLHEEFSQLVLRFTDGTYDEVKKRFSRVAAQAEILRPHWNQYRSGCAKTTSSTWTVASCKTF